MILTMNKVKVVLPRPPNQKNQTLCRAFNLNSLKWFFLVECHFLSELYQIDGAFVWLEWRLLWYVLKLPSTLLYCRFLSIEEVMSLIKVCETFIAFDMLTKRPEADLQMIRRWRPDKELQEVQNEEPSRGERFRPRLILRFQRTTSLR